MAKKKVNSTQETVEKTVTETVEAPVTDAPENSVQEQEILNDYLKETDRGENPKKESGNVETIRLMVSKGWIGNQFTSKAGHELVEVKVPHADRNNKNPWPSFVTDPRSLHECRFGGAFWMDVPKNGYVTMKQPKRIGTNENGKGVYENHMTRIANTDLKTMIENVRNSSWKKGENHDGHAQQVQEGIDKMQDDVPDFLKTQSKAR